MLHEAELCDERCRILCCMRQNEVELYDAIGSNFMMYEAEVYDG